MNDETFIASVIMLTSLIGAILTGLLFHQLIISFINWLTFVFSVMFSLLAISVIIERGYN